MNYFKWRYNFEFDSKHDIDELEKRFMRIIDEGSNNAVPLDESYNKLRYKKVSDYTYRIHMAEWLRDLNFSISPPRPKVIFNFSRGIILVEVTNRWLLSKSILVLAIILLVLLQKLNHGELSLMIFGVIAVIVALTAIGIENLRDSLHIVEKLARELQEDKVETGANDKLTPHG